MRLHALELTGFGPFRETQRVDFDAFAGDGVFLISGRTGAGKSSILDGVSFALYGSVPRYDGGEKRLRSDHCAPSDPSEVRLEFTIGDTRWRVTRAPEYDRPAKRGGGLTTEPPRAELEERVDGVWVGRAAKPRDVGLALGELLGLGAQQFQQVILLAQNKFSRFLLAPGDERQMLLRTLFGTRRFEEYRDALEERRRGAQTGLDAAGARARTLLDLAEQLVDEHGAGDAAADRPSDLTARRAALLAAQARADYRVEQAATERAQAGAASAAAASAHAALVERAQRAEERGAMRARLSALEERAPEVATSRERRDRARAAEPLRVPLVAADRAAATHSEALAAGEAARAAWVDAGGAASADAPARVEQLTAALARWADAAQLERAAEELRTRIAAHDASLTAIDAELATLDEQLAQVPGRRAALDAAASDARTRAARHDDLARRLAELRARAGAAREAVALTEQAEVAERAHLAARRAADTAGRAETDLLQRRMTGYAGELSAALVEGEPCAVCGSTTHPDPAAPSDDPVTDDDLAAAERARAAANTTVESAAAAAREARERRDAARARAGGQDAAAIEVELTEVQAEAAAAESAGAELTALLGQREQLELLAIAAREERTELEARRASTREERASAASDAQRSAAAIDAARGEFATVAERIAAGEAERDRARAVVEATAREAECERALTAAAADRDALLEASPFTDVDDVRAALVAPAELAQLEADLDAHATALSATRARLLELELAVTGDDVGADELARSSEAVAASDAARTAAIAAERDAQLTAGRLRDLSQQVDDACAGIADLAAEAEVVTRLADTVAGRAPNTRKMDLETFVLAAELEEIVAAANLRLAQMSAGRYTLHHTDARAARGRASGLGIEVLDAHTGRLRSPQSLSGGETFLASLALALGLGEVVTSRAGGIRLDTLFVDEGFGSLDPETLELAMRTLDELRAGGRAVGVISHVEAMKEQLPAQLVVEATPEGPSVIRQDVAVPAG